jgi:hypothetical protein
VPHPDTIPTTAIIGCFQTGCFAPGYTVLLAPIKAQPCLCFFPPDGTYSTGDKRRYQKNKELENGALSEYKGVVKYHPLFVAIEGVA